MARTTKKAAAAALLAAEQAALLAAEQAAEEISEEGAEEEAEIRAPRSVVAAAYKAKYRARPDSNKGRHCADWLAKRLAVLVLRDGKLDVSELEAICEENAVSAAYPNRSKGWEGRMRMTLGLRLRPVVAAQGYLLLPGGEQEGAPAEFCAAWRK